MEAKASKRPRDDADADVSSPKRHKQSPIDWDWSEVNVWVNQEPRQQVLSQYINEDSLLCNGEMLHFAQTSREEALSTIISNPCHLAFVLSELDVLFGNPQDTPAPFNWTSSKVLDWTAQIVASKMTTQVDTIVDSFRTHGILSAHMLRNLLLHPDWLQNPLGINKLLGHFLLLQIRSLFASSSATTSLTTPSPTPPFPLPTKSHQSASTPPTPTTQLTVATTTTPTSTAPTPAAAATTTTVSQRPLLIRSIVVMHASPLVHLNPLDHKSLVAVQSLDLLEEERIIQTIKSETKSPVHLTFVEGSVAFFDQACRCCVLHLSGHGLAPSPSSEAGLMFEAPDGSAMIATASDLEGLLLGGGSPCSIQCVVLSTCSSMHVAHAFLRAGAGSAIITTSEVLDEYAQKFNESFYRRLLGHSHRTEMSAIDMIYQAFQIAKARVYAECKDEGLKYEFRTRDANPAPCIAEGSSTISSSPLTKSVPSTNTNTNASITTSNCANGHIKGEVAVMCFADMPDCTHTTKLSTSVDHFLGRELDMHQILVMLNNSRLRLVHIKGAVGIGKTTLVRALAVHMDRRRFWRSRFRDGIYFVGLQCPTSAEAVNEAMFSAMQSQKGQSPDWLERDMPPMDETTFRLRLRDCHSLFFLDGCDSVMDEMGSFLTKLLDTCHNIKIVCSSRRRLPQMADHVPAVYNLPDLSKETCKLLFQKLCSRRIDKEELSLACQEGLDNQLLLWMSEHPASIVVAARMLSHKSISDVTFRLDTLSREGPVEDLQLLKLECSLDEVCRQLTDEARRLYVLLGLLPCGASEALLDAAYSVRASWKQIMDQLVDSSLVVPSDFVPSLDVLGESQTRYRLAFPFSVSHARKQALSSDDKFKTSQFHAVVCKFYADRCERIRKVWFGPQSQQAVRWLQVHEENMWDSLDVGVGLQLVSPLRQSLALASGYPASLATAAAGLCDMLRRKERKKDATKAVELGLRISTTHTCLLGQAKCLFAQSKTLVEARQIEKARLALITAICLFATTSDLRSYMDALSVLVNHKISFGGQYAENVLAHVLEQCPSVIPATCRARTDVLMPTTDLIDLVVQLARELGEGVCAASMTLARGQLALVAADTPITEKAIQSRRIFDEALMLFRAHGDVFGEAEAEQRLGELDLRLNDRLGALKRFERAQQLYDKCQMFIPRLNVIRIIGEIHFELARQTTSTHLQTNHQQQQQQQPHLQSHVQSEASIAHSNNADKLLHHVRDQFNKCGRKFGEAGALRVLGDLYAWLSVFLTPHAAARRVRAIQYFESTKQRLREMDNHELTPQEAKIRLHACRKLLEIYCDKDTLGIAEDECRRQAKSNLDEASSLIDYLLPTSPTEFIHLLEEMTSLYSNTFDADNPQNNVMNMVANFFE